MLQGYLFEFPSPLPPRHCGFWQPGPPEIFDWGLDDALAGRSSSATPFEDFEFLWCSGTTQSPSTSNLSFDYDLFGIDSLRGLGGIRTESGIGEFGRVQIRGCTLVKNDPLEPMRMREERPEWATVIDRSGVGV